MKKIIAFILFSVLFISFVMYVTFPPHKLYTLNARVHIVDYNEDFTVFEDDAGNTWGIWGTEVPIRGTRVILTMDSNNTDTIYDDGIIKFEVAR